MSEALTREIDELRLLMGSPRDPHGRVFAQLGDALRRAGSHREALGVLLDGVAEHPNFSPGHLVLGWTAQETGDSEVARTAFERTVELDPENPNALYGLGRILSAAGDPRGDTLISEAESLDARVGETAPVPGSVPSMRDPAPGAGDPDLEHLPFLSLAELAPEAVEADDAAPGAEAEDLSHLPFVPLHELAPDAQATEAGGAVAEDPDSPQAGDPGFDGLPFVSLEELRPEAPEVSSPEESVPSSPESGEDTGAGEEELDLGGPLATRTMGELLVRQGLTAQAVEVFEVLVARSPEDAGLQARLEELRAELGVAPDGPGSEGEGADVPSPTAEALTDPEALEEAHDTAAHPSMDPPVPHPELPSPFHLGEGDGEDVAEEEGERVGDYFARLLAWSPAPPADESGAGGEPEGEEPSS